jgi:hypothetical protein
VGAEDDGVVGGLVDGAALEDDDESQAASNALPERRAVIARPEIARLLPPNRLCTAKP